MIRRTIRTRIRLGLVTLTMGYSLDVSAALQEPSPCPELSKPSVWATCPRGDRMISLLVAGTKLDSTDPDRLKLTLALCRVASLALPYVRPDDPRPLRGVEAAEAWGRGGAAISRAQLEQAVHAANDSLDEAVKAANAVVAELSIKAATKSRADAAYAQASSEFAKAIAVYAGAHSTEMVVQANAGLKSADDALTAASIVRRDAFLALAAAEEANVADVTFASAAQACYAAAIFPIASNAGEAADEVVVAAGTCWSTAARYAAARDLHAAQAASDKDQDARIAAMPAAGSSARDELLAKCADAIRESYPAGGSVATPSAP